MIKSLHRSRTTCKDYGRIFLTLSLLFGRSFKVKTWGNWPSLVTTFRSTKGWEEMFMIESWPSRNGKASTKISRDYLVNFLRKREISKNTLKRKEKKYKHRARKKLAKWRKHWKKKSWENKKITMIKRKSQKSKWITKGKYWVRESTLKIKRKKNWDN